jgi:hypothetical protein
MSGRRDFLKSAIGSTAAWMLIPSLLEDVVLAEDSAPTGTTGLRFTSDSIWAELSKDAPEFTALSIDGLGKGRRGANIVDARGASSGFKAASSKSGETLRVEYRSNGADENAVPEWTVEFTSKRIVLTSKWSPGADPVPMNFRFSLPQVHSTVLGAFRKDDKLLAVPALMHFPGQGSVRISANVPALGLTYQSTWHQPLATLMFPGATFEHKRVVYTLDVTAIYPDVPGIAGDDRFDAFRRNWMNILQLNPGYGGLANNTASTSCAFCYYEFADIAALTPPLAEGLTALDLVRVTLDRVLAGGMAYGLPMPGNFPTPSSDTFPSLLIAAAHCARAGRDDKWLTASYDGIRGWGESMLATDSDGNGLFKYSVSGNSGTWPNGFPMVRPSNWWDTIGFGHEDAYGNALAFRALQDLAMMAGMLGKSADAMRYHAAAEKLRRAYYERFYNPETGVLGGWRSADGKLHDYYFLWVNGIAIHYGLVTKPQANAIMDKLLAKMQEVGYDKFNMGLPGNLITVALNDYVHKAPDGRFGGGVRPDNSDGFQNYENGGATGCFVFFTLAALYDLGRKSDADKILFAMLGEYDRCGFEGRGAKDRSNDWRRWDGTPMGGEGFLVDNYYTLLSVPLRQAETTWHRAFRTPSLP